MQKLTDINLTEIKFYSFVTGKWPELNDVIISATGYTGAGGFELYCKNEDAEKLWKAVFEAGRRIWN
jgi:aminomethyltransferase